MRDDPEARLLIYFHGNAGTLAQQRRTEEYRSYASGACEKVFVLAFDYRGFGKSGGEPSETGLRNDAEAVVDWALNVARIAPDRIVLLGHSLGTAVATAVAVQYAEMGIECAGIILCAAFTNAGNAFASYSIAGVIPVLAPVKLIPAVQRWFSRQMQDTWQLQVDVLTRKLVGDRYIESCECAASCRCAFAICEGRTATDNVNDRKVHQITTSVRTC